SSLVLSLELMAASPEFPAKMAAMAVFPGKLDATPEFTPVGLVDLLDMTLPPEFSSPILSYVSA
ncbi:hypothetical protein M9458_029274, partial [Cirrhinus mrigala]